MWSKPYPIAHLVSTHTLMNKRGYGVVWWRDKRRKAMGLRLKPMYWRTLCGYPAMYRELDFGWFSIMLGRRWQIPKGAIIMLGKGGHNAG